MTDEKKAFIEWVRLVVRSEIHLWHHPNDQELQDIWDKRIVKALDQMDQKFGGRFE